MAMDRSVKRAHLAEAMGKGKIWYAACESQHPFWSGDERDS
jgi:hypothetical protein